MTKLTPVFPDVQKSFTSLNFDVEYHKVDYTSKIAINNEAPVFATYTVSDGSSKNYIVAPEKVSNLPNGTKINIVIDKELPNQAAEQLWEFISQNSSHINNVSIIGAGFQNVAKLNTPLPNITSLSVQDSMGYPKLFERAKINFPKLRNFQFGETSQGSSFTR